MTADTTTETTPDRTDTDRPVAPTRPARTRGVLTTSVVGSFSVPDWLGRFNTDFHRGRVSAALLDEIHETAIKSALIDQEVAGLDVVSDGEFRRDNDMDYFLARIEGLDLGGPKAYYYDYYEPVLSGALPDPKTFPGFGIVADLAFLRARTSRTVTTSLPGPFSLSRRITNRSGLTEAELVDALAALIHTEAVRLAEAGATHIQLDEPFLAGHPDRVELAIAGVNTVTEGVDAHVALHVCYGNRYARPAWEGHYDFLFPAVLGAQVDELVLEFGRKGLDDLELFRRYPNDFEVGCGVIDVKSTDVESPELVAQRLYQAVRILPPDRLVVNPDCGLRHLPPSVARAKLESMVAGAAIVRADVLGERGSVRGSGRDALAFPPPLRADHSAEAPEVDREVEEPSATDGLQGDGATATPAVTTPDPAMEENK